jgi:DNA-binding MarR family transcriptional regulator
VTRDAASGYRAMSSVLRLHHVMTTIVDRELKTRFAISLVDYQVLKALQASDSGTQLLGRLARELVVHVTTVTSATDRLESSGLVQRHPHPADRRATLVTITDDGRRCVDAATDALTRVNFGLPGLTPAQLQLLTDIIAGLRADAGPGS